jgi:hypothetical protein
MESYTRAVRMLSRFYEKEPDGLPKRFAWHLAASSFNFRMRLSGIGISSLILKRKRRANCQASWTKRRWISSWQASRRIKIKIVFPQFMAAVSEYRKRWVCKFPTSMDYLSDQINPVWFGPTMLDVGPELTHA